MNERIGCFVDELHSYIKDGEDVRHLFLDQRLGLSSVESWRLLHVTTPTGPRQVVRPADAEPGEDRAGGPRPVASEVELGDDQLVGMGQRFLARAAQHGLGMSGHCRAVNDHRPRWLRSFDLAPGGKVCGYDTGRSSGDHSCSVFSSSRDRRPKAARARAVALLGPKSY